MLSFSHLNLKSRLTDVCGHADAGQFVHVMGTNGSGKSSLLHTLAGLLQPDSGEVYLKQRNIKEFSLPQLASFRCLQEQQHTSMFALTVAELLYFFSGQRDLPEQLEQALELKAFLHRPISRLSGGEAGRVHIARALLQVWPAINQGQAIILLDEPNQGLDFKHQHLLFSLLAAICDQQNLVIVNHHDLNLCQQYAHKIWLMQEGRIAHALYSLNDISHGQLAQVFGCAIECAINHRGNKIFQTYLE